MIFSDACIFRGEKGFVKGSFSVADGRIRQITPSSRDDSGQAEVFSEDLLQEERILLEGKYILPGLVDIHTHGNSGCDFSDADEEGLIRMGKYLASHGITSFAPTSMTLPYERLKAAFLTAAAYMNKRPGDGARVAGVHMEGPFFSEKKKGAQNSAFLKLPDSRGFLDLQDACGGAVKIVDIAPELPGAEAFIQEISPVCRVSVAHTDASYEEARRAFDAGASHVTHLFNAMPPINHRSPGVIGAAFERDDVTAELICDGLHIHPSIVRMAFRLFPGRICLISDALRCCGMPDGEYELGGQQVTLQGGAARLADGTIAGAACSLYEDMVNAIRFGIPVKEAILAATLTPAREIGMDQEIGSLEMGKRADFIVCDENWNLEQVYVDGVRVR